MKLIYKFTAYPEAGETLLGTFKLSCINVCIDPNREDQTCIILFFSLKLIMCVCQSKKVSSGNCSIINGLALLHYNQFTIPCHFFVKCGTSQQALLELF